MKEGGIKDDFWVFAGAGAWSRALRWGGLRKSTQRGETKRMVLDVGRLRCHLLAGCKWGLGIGVSKLSL